LWDLPEDNKKFGLVYANVDRGVIQNAREDERIEEHVSSRHPGKTNVQVIKLPYYSRKEPGRIVGVQGFYWEVAEKNIREVQATILQKLEQIYRPFDMLNTIPVPVLRKDVQLRFIYGNKAYIEDLSKISTTLFRVTSLHDIIGKTDQQVFPKPIATKYEADDFEIITGRKPRIRKIEKHGDGYVEVVKSPVNDGHEVVGVQAIFWRVVQKGSRAG
jgi:hypothetical protein